MPAEFIIGAAIGAAAVSTRVRKAVRRGLIYGVGGVLVAYDRVAAGAHAVAQSARDATATKDGGAPAANGTAAPAADADSVRPPVEAAAGTGTPS
jgi:hypothetical protein